MLYIEILSHEERWGEEGREGGKKEEKRKDWVGEMAHQVKVLAVR